MLFIHGLYFIYVNVGGILNDEKLYRYHNFSAIKHYIMWFFELDKYIIQGNWHAQKKKNEYLRIQKRKSKRLMRNNKKVDEVTL